MGRRNERRSTLDEVIGTAATRRATGGTMNQENSRTRGRLWLRAAGLAGRRGGEPFAPPAVGVGPAPTAAATRIPRPPREESRIVRFCLVVLLTALTTTLWFALLFQKEATPSYLTDEA